MRDMWLPLSAPRLDVRDFPTVASTRTVVSHGAPQHIMKSDATQRNISRLPVFLTTPVCKAATAGSDDDSGCGEAVGSQR